MPRVPKGIKAHTIERIALSAMKPAPYNPRSITPKNKEALRTSMRRFGNLQPIVFNRKSGNIVGGHQRYNLLLETGETATDAIVVDVGPAEEKAMNVALNAGSVTGAWTDMLGPLLEEIQADDADLFRDLNLDDLLKVPGIDNDDAEDSPRDEDAEKAPLQEVVSYQIVFDNRAQQDDFYTFLAALRKWYPDDDTMGARIARYAREAVKEAAPR